MLRFLRIRDFALIRELEVDFGPGLNLLTGETGSGKSILVDAIGLLLGGRASAEMIRTGAEEASLEALFDLSGREAQDTLRRFDLDPDEALARTRYETALRTIGFDEIHHVYEPVAAAYFFAQRLKRRCTFFQSPKRSARSRQGMPAR